MIKNIFYYFIVLIFLSLSVVNLFFYNRIIFPFNYLLYSVLCILTGVFLVRAILKSLIQLNEKNIYVVVFMLLPVLFCYINIQSTNRVIFISQVLIAAVIYPIIQSITIINANRNKYIGKSKLQFLKLVNIIMISINSIFGSLVFILSDKIIQDKLKVLLIPLVSVLMFQKVSLEYISYINTKEP